jgi:hypothetical protein
LIVSSSLNSSSDSAESDDSPFSNKNSKISEKICNDCSNNKIIFPMGMMKLLFEIHTMNNNTTIRTVVGFVGK